MTDPVRCPACDEDIRPARCREGWCADCNRSNIWGQYYAPRGVEVYCKAHRVYVNPDDHCALWETDK
jgi:hypothetical protein